MAENVPAGEACSHDPAERNEQELMDYYHLKGRLGAMRLKLRLGGWWLMQAVAQRVPSYELAASLHRMRGVKLGKHVYIGPRVNIDDLYPELVEIEDNVSIGMNSMVFAHSNPTTCVYIKENYYGRIVKPVKIRKGAWIAPGCIILAGVEIGENSIIGAGSVVTKNVEPHTVVAGVPAKFIKDLRK